MADIVNLRTARKRKLRERDARAAADNRLRHGTPRVIRQVADAERADAIRKLDGVKRERPIQDDDSSDGHPGTAGDPA